jgi:hypothetical protein
MIEEGMVFSDYDEFGEERYYCVTEVYDGLEERTFGAKSKLLGFFAPGAYQAKEAAKYGYDDYDEYKKDRAGYALKGLFTPGTATYMKKKAQQMYEDGKSTKEIREFLENRGKISF